MKIKKWYNILMAIMLNGQDLGTQSELQKRVTAELREKQSRTQLTGDFDGPKYNVDDSTYMKDLKPTTSLAWVWALIIAAVIGVLIAIVVMTV